MPSAARWNWAESGRALTLAAFGRSWRRCVEALHIGSRVDGSWTSNKAPHGSSMSHAPRRAQLCQTMAAHLGEPVRHRWPAHVADPLRGVAPLQAGRMRAEAQLRGHSSEMPVLHADASAAEALIRRVFQGHWNRQATALCWHPTTMPLSLRFLVSQSFPAPGNGGRAHWYSHARRASQSPIAKVWAAKASHRYGHPDASGRLVQGVLARARMFPEHGQHRVAVPCCRHTSRPGHVLRSSCRSHRPETECSRP